LAQQWSRRSFLEMGIGATTALSWRRLHAESVALASLSIRQASELLRQRQASPVDLTKACLERIDKFNAGLNAFVTVTSDEALATARDMESEQRRGKWRGVLHGIPVALKDNIDTRGIRTTAASELFRDRVPTEDADVVRRLRSAGGSRSAS
jgi:aspartyl-tRNA(Asn)/glutamyl-tRNA(Gln) amidotransferase subunit A